MLKKVSQKRKNIEKIQQKKIRGLLKKYGKFRILSNTFYLCCPLIKVILHVFQRFIQALST